MTPGPLAWLFGPVFEAEATRLCEILLAQQDISPLLNLGSSDARFRRETRPHIEARLFAPLRQAGVEVVHADLKQAPGVDVVGDILDPVIVARLQAMKFRCVLVSNLLEHVRDRAAVASACETIAGPDALILASAPSSYPYHADPIDTGYRPAPGQLAAVFAGSRPLLAEEVDGETFADRISAGGGSVVGEIVRTLLWCLAFPLRPKSARARLDRWRWYKSPYRASIALVVVGSRPASNPS